MTGKIAEKTDYVLELTPFSLRDEQKKWKINTFRENGLDFSILVENKKLKKIPSGDRWKFGVKTKDDIMFWFFQGRATVNSRNQAVKFHRMLADYCVKNSLGTAFAYKLQSC